MTAKSIIDVEVQSAAFEKFTQLFDKYSETLRKQPDLWKKIQGEHAKVAQGFAALGNATEKHLEALEKIKELGDDQEKHVAFSGSMWSDIEKASGNTAKHVSATTTSFLKWKGLLSGSAAGFSAIAGGTLYGLDRMANSVSGWRQQSLATGSSIGQLKAFGTDFARFGDANLLPAVNAMETDRSEQGPWRWLQLGAMSGNTVEDAIKFASAVRDFARRTPLNLMGNVAKNIGLPEDAGTLRTYANTGDDAWARLMTQARADARTMDVPAKTADAWQTLSTQIGRNLSTVSSAFETQLGRATPLLSKFSDALSTATADFITRAGNYIAKKYDAEKKDPWKALLDMGMDAIDQIMDVRPGLGPGGAVGPSWSDLASKITGPLRNSVFNQKLAGLDAQFGLPPGLLEVTRSIESGTNFSPAASSKGALGVFQFMPGTAKQYGIKNLLDPDQEALGAARFYRDLSKQFHGNIPEMLAAYNDGPAKVGALVGRYGDDEWSRHIRESETKDYLRKAAAAFKPYAVDIQIVNKTGSDVTAIMSGLGSTK